MHSLPTERRRSFSTIAPPVRNGACDAKPDEARQPSSLTNPEFKTGLRLIQFHFISP